MNKKGTEYFQTQLPQQSRIQKITAPPKIQDPTFLSKKKNLEQTPPEKKEKKKKTQTRTPSDNKNLTNC